MLTMEAIRRRVASGAAFLDHHKPGWTENITRPVRVVSTHNCILAQLYGRYQTGVELLALDEVATLALGFRVQSAEVGGTHMDREEYYRRLDQCWQAEILKRR